MRKELVAGLVDPVDGSPLTVLDASQSGDEVETGKLVASSGRTYRVHGGIPRFVPDDDYAGSFSFEWLTHARTQLDSERSDESMRVFLRDTGFDEVLVRGAKVLDAGVGSGRFADVALRLGAAQVYGLDLSRAVESAWQNLGADDRFGVVQANIFAPPFSDESFDLVFSIGVLHHTPAPRLAFERLVRLLRPGGRIAIFVYPDTPTNIVSDAIRRVTTRMEPSQLYRMVGKVQPLLDAISSRAAGRLALRWLPRSGDPRPDWRVLDTFDWYSPKYQFRYRNHEEICEWFTSAGLVDVRPLPFDICVQGRKRS
ncbi:MAG TPA: methyltransferase domain-containing protein [Polyangiaceae bacterium]